MARVASGECQASYCLSEADAGSDVAGMRTKAVRDGDHYVLTGRKLWITNAGVSDFYTVFAKTDPDAGHRGISCFVVEKGFPGLLARKLEHKLGVRGSPTGEVVLDECAGTRREPHRRGGPAASRTRWARSTARVRSSARRRSASPRARSTSRRSYVQERKQFGPADRRVPGSAVHARRHGHRGRRGAAARLPGVLLLDDGLGGTPTTASASSMAKLFASDTAMRVTTDCVQLLGGVGYTKELAAERFIRDAKITQIYEGTNQIQRVVIAKRSRRIARGAYTRMPHTFQTCVTEGPVRALGHARMR